MSIIGRAASSTGSRCTSRLLQRCTPFSRPQSPSPSPFHLPHRLAHYPISSGLTSDQLAYQQTALDFAATELAPHAAEWDRTHHFPIPTLRKAAALGFAGVYVRDDVGGSALGRRDGAVIFEALATADVSTSAYLTIHNMVAWMIDTFGSDEQRRRLLPSITSMERLCSYCLTEPSSGSDAAALLTTAKLSPSGSHYTLTGSKAFISGAGDTDVYLIMARTGGPGPSGISAFIVEKGTPGLSFGKREMKLGWNSQPTRAVILDGVEVPATNRLGAEGEGFRIAMRGLDGGRVNIGATALGGAIACLDYAVEYTKGRKQFGAAVASFQATQFGLAEMAAKVTAGRLMVARAAEGLDGKEADASMWCAMGKRFATNAAFEVCNAALQMLGGYGYLNDYPVERFVRDVRVHQILEGTNEVMQMIVARHILKD